MTLDPLIILAAIVGYFARVLEQWLRARWEAGQAREARQETKREKLDDIQRATLLDLRQALQELGSTVAQVHVAMRDTDHLDPSDPGVRFVPDDLDQAYSSVHGRVLLLTERVRDAGVRTATQEAALRSTFVGISPAAPRIRADHLGSFFDARNKAESTLGPVLRELL